MIKTIIKRIGSTEDFSPSKVNGWGVWAAKTLGSPVDWSSVVIDAVNQCPETCSSQQLQETLITTCLNRKTWEYNRMAGRLYTYLIERLIYPTGRPSVKELHKELFSVGLMVKLNYYDDEYESIEKIIDHKRELKYPHYQLNQIRFKYAIRNKVTGKEYESSQFVYMRMAMALAENEPRAERLVHVKAWYDHFSYNRINCPTPNFVNLGTKLNGYASCFPAGTLVDTVGGQIPIENVSIRDKVLGLSGTFCDVIGTTSRSYSGDLFNFQTTLTYNDYTKSTSDHRFMIRKKDRSNIEWTEAKNISKGDYIYYPLPKEIDEKVSVWDLVSEKLSCLNYQCKNDVIGRVNVCDNVGSFSKKHKISKNIQVKNNVDLYRLMGYYLAEGCIKRNVGKDNRAVLGLTFASTETEYIEDARNLFASLFGIYVSVRDDTEKDNSTRLGIHSLPVILLFEILCGTNSKNKGDKLGLILTSDKESIESLLVGYIRGDGCAVPTGYTTSSVSKDMSDMVRLAALKMGYTCSTTMSFPGKGSYPNGSPAYVVRITLQPGDSLVVKTNKNVHKIRSRGIKGKRDYTIFVNGGVLSKVREINKVQFSGTVYDFEVENDHSFTVDGMCVHNCCLYTTDDTAPSLATGDHIAYMMTCMSAGIGTHIKTRSLGDPVRGGVIQHQGKLPYYRSMVGAIQANMQNGRGGASTIHYTAYDPEVEVIQKLRNPMTPANKKIAGCHYSFGSNKFFARKVAKNESIYLFSYEDSPALYEAQYSKDQAQFETLYDEMIASRGRARAKVNARDLLLGAMTQSYETGVHYAHMTDMMNQHTPFNDTIYSSNLCQEINIPTKDFEGVSELYKDNYEEGDGEIGLCSLAGVIVSNIESDEQYADVAYYALKMIDKCIHKSDYIFPNLAHTAKARMSAGVGILGLAHLMAKKGMTYSDEAGRNFIHELFETHSWHLINASLRLGKELGNAPWMHKTKWPDGWLPLDTYEKRVDEVHSAETKRDWELLRKEIIKNKGIRNSVVAAMMPGESCLEFSTKIKTDQGDLDFREIAEKGGFTKDEIQEIELSYSPVEGGQWHQLKTPVNILSTDGYKSVDKLWFNGFANTMTIELEDGRKVTATHHHKFLVNNPNGKKVWKMMIELKEGDDIIDISDI